MADSIEKIAEDIFRAAYFTGGTDEDVFYEAGPRLEALGLSFKDLDKSLKPLKEKYKTSRPKAADNIYDIITSEFSGDEMRRAYQSLGIDPGEELKSRNAEKAAEAAEAAEVAEAAEAEANPQTNSKPLTLDDIGGSGQENPNQAPQPNRAPPRDMDQPSPGMSPLKTAISMQNPRTGFDLEGKRSPNEQQYENIQKKTLDKANFEMTLNNFEDKRDAYLDQKQRQKERIFQENYLNSPYGFSKYGSFDKVSPEMQQQLRDKYSDAQIRGRERMMNQGAQGSVGPQGPAGTPGSPVRENIPQQQFDNMSMDELDSQLPDSNISTLEPMVATATKPKSKTRYIPEYGSEGFRGFRDTTDGFFIKNSGVGRDKQLQSLMLQDAEDSTSRSKFQNNNPFGTQYRPGARQPIQASPQTATMEYPKTDAVMRDLNSRSKKEQLDVINRFRNHRGEDSIYNPFV
jgi:hypothetical protein